MTEGSTQIHPALVQDRDSEIEAARNVLSDLMLTDCRLPRVVNEMFALNPGAVATTWKLPLPPRPSRVP